MTGWIRGYKSRVFITGVTFGVRQLIGAAVGGLTDHNTSLQVYDLIEQIAMNSHTWGGKRIKRKATRVHNVEVILAMEARPTVMIE